MLRKLRFTAAVICLLSFPGVLYATVPRGGLIPSQYSSDREAVEVRNQLVGELVRQQFCALGVPEEGALALADAVADSGMIAAFDRVMRAQPGPVEPHALMEDPAVREAIQLCAATLVAEATVTSEPEAAKPIAKKSRPKVVGVNIPGVVLVLLPVVVIVAVTAAASGGAGSLIAVGLVAGVILVLFAAPEIIFGER